MSGGPSTPNTTHNVRAAASRSPLNFKARLLAPDCDGAGRLERRSGRRRGAAAGAARDAQLQGREAQGQK
eukprot:1291742-Prymnesium_polylepis.1